MIQKSCTVLGAIVDSHYGAKDYREMCVCVCVCVYLHNTSYLGTSAVDVY